jgi:hypothetical protein
MRAGLRRPGGPGRRDQRASVAPSPNLRTPLAVPDRVRVRLDLYRRTPCAGPAATQEPPRGLPAPRSTAAPRQRPTSPHAPEHPLRLASNRIVERTMETTVRRFDRRASTYETSALQPFLFGPVQHTALQLARQHLPQARRILEVGCGTGQLLRRARPCYPLASLIGIDLAGQMLATANALTPEKLSVDFIRAQAEQCRSRTQCSTWCSPPCRCGTGRIPRPGSPRSAECSRWMVRSSSPTSFQGIRTQSGCSMLRRRPAQIPTDLGRMLALHRLAVVGCNRTRWFRLPGVQVIAVRKTTTTRRPRSASSARRWTRGQR